MKLSYAISVCNELKEISELLPFLIQYKGADDVQVWVRATQDGAFGVGSREWLDTVKAGFYPEQNAVVFIAENIDSIQDIDSTIQHELLVHKGLGLFEAKDVQGLIDVVNSNAYKSKALGRIEFQLKLAISKVILLLKHSICWFLIHPSLAVASFLK